MPNEMAYGKYGTASRQVYAANGRIFQEIVVFPRLRFILLTESRFRTLNGKPFQLLNGVLWKRIFDRTEHVGDLSTATIPLFHKGLQTDLQLDRIVESCFFINSEELSEEYRVGIGWDIEGDSRKPRWLLLCQPPDRSC